MYENVMKIKNHSETINQCQRNANQDVIRNSHIFSPKKRKYFWMSKAYPLLSLALSLAFMFVCFFNTLPHDEIISTQTAG